MKCPVLKNKFNYKIYILNNKTELFKILTFILRKYKIELKTEISTISNYKKIQLNIFIYHIFITYYMIYHSV